MIGPGLPRRQRWCGETGSRIGKCETISVTRIGRRACPRTEARSGITNRLARRSADPRQPARERQRDRARAPGPRASQTPERVRQWEQAEAVPRAVEASRSRALRGEGRNVGSASSSLGAGDTRQTNGPPGSGSRPRSYQAQGGRPSGWPPFRSGWCAAPYRRRAHRNRVPAYRARYSPPSILPPTVDPPACDPLQPPPPHSPIDMPEPARYCVTVIQQ